MILTGRAALVALLGVPLVLIAPAPAPVLLAVEGALLLGVLADLVLAGSVRGLRLERSGSTTVRLGDSATVSIVIENRGRRRVRGLLRDAWPPSAQAVPRSTPVDVPAGERRRTATTLTPTRRGDREAAAVTVRSLGPLGLAARQRSHRVPRTVRVLPPFHSRRHLPAKLARLRELEGSNPTMIRGQGTEFDSLREYVIGDDVRSIDWRATARRHDVVVRTWRPERDRRVLIVLDTGRTSAGRVGDIPRLDASMDAALLLAALATRAGDHVDFFAYDREVRSWVPGATPAPGLSSMVNAMAGLEASLVESDGAGMVSAALARIRHRTLVVLLTDLNPATWSEGLLGALPPLMADHVLLVAAVADPRVDEMAAGRGDAAAVYEAAAAERTRGSRAGVTTVLRRKGAEVVDAAPDVIAPALADAYLALKALGRL